MDNWAENSEKTLILSKKIRVQVGQGLVKASWTRV